MTTYTAMKEMEAMVGHGVVAQLGDQIQVLAATLDRVENNLATVKTDLATVKTDLATVKTDLGTVKTDLGTVKTDLGTVKTDVAVLKKEVRLIWGALVLAVPTLTAVLVRLFGG